MKAAEICLKTVAGSRKVEGSGFQEKFCFQAHEVVQRCMSKATEEFKAEVQSATQRYKDKTESKKLQRALRVQPDRKCTSGHTKENIYQLG